MAKTTGIREKKSKMNYHQVGITEKLEKVNCKYCKNKIKCSDGRGSYIKTWYICKHIEGSQYLAINTQKDTCDWFEREVE